MSKEVHFKELDAPTATKETAITIDKTSAFDEFPPSSHSAAIINFVSTFIYDLDVSPFANEEDAAAIQKLGWSHKVSDLRIWVRKTFPAMTEFFKAPGVFPGRRICSIHNQLATTLLFNLHDLILDEISMESPQFCAPRLNNEYLFNFREINRIWDKGYRNKILNDSVKQLHPPLQNHSLYQDNNCAGCCLRRILSDVNILSLLIITVRFKELGCHDKERELTDYLEASWEVLAEKHPQMFGSWADTMRARDQLELSAFVLAERSKRLKKKE